MKRIFIVNETSGQGRAFEAARAACEICITEGLDAEFIRTRYPKEATEIASAWAKKGHVLYSVGGDGTLNEVINGLVGKEGYFGVLPCGTGNDFFRMIDNDTERVDVMTLNCQYAINVLSFGIDAAVAEVANQLKKKGRNDAGVYLESIVCVLPSYDAPLIEIDGRKTSLTLLAVCNGKYYGNGIPVNPSADLAKEKLDLYFVSQVSKLKMMYLFSKLLKGKYETQKEVEKHTIKRLEIFSDPALICNVDGEIVRDTHYRIGILPKAVCYYQEDNPKLRKLIFG